MPKLLISVESCTPREDGSVAVKLFPHQVTANKEIVFKPEHYTGVSVKELQTRAEQAIQILELQAKIERISAFIKLSAAKWNGIPEVEPTMWNLLRVIEKTPAECLIEIKAVAGREAYRHCLNHWATAVLPSAFNGLCENYYDQVIKRGNNEPTTANS